LLVKIINSVDFLTEMCRG